jgi:hypothetical protein
MPNSSILRWEFEEIFPNDSVAASKAPSQLILSISPVGCCHLACIVVFFAASSFLLY